MELFIVCKCVDDVFLSQLILLHVIQLLIDYILADGKEPLWTNYIQIIINNDDDLLKSFDEITSFPLIFLTFPALSLTPGKFWQCGNVQVRPPAGQHRGGGGREETPAQYSRAPQRF